MPKRAMQEVISIENALFAFVKGNSAHIFILKSKICPPLQYLPD
jgi:hypothetical protein